MKITKAKRGRHSGGSKWQRERKEGWNGSTSRHVGRKARKEIPVHPLPDPTHPLVLWEEEAVSKHTWQLRHPSPWGKDKKNKTMAASLCTEFAASLKQKIKDSKNGKEGGKKNSRSAHCVKTHITIATLAEEEGRIPERWRENIHWVRGEAKRGGRKEMECCKIQAEWSWRNTTAWYWTDPCVASKVWNQKSGLLHFSMFLAIKPA